MQRSVFLLFICISICALSCVNVSQLKSYTVAAKEPGLSNFVALKNGDTLRGTAKKLYKENWKVGGKSVRKSDVTAYQNKHGYFENGTIRIIKGKLSMFGYMKDNARYTSSYSTTTNSFQTQHSGGTTTTFYLKYMGGRTVELSYNVLKAAVQDCPVAVEKLESEFKGTYTIKHPDWSTNHYPKLIKVIELYNSRCP